MVTTTTVLVREALHPVLVDTVYEDYLGDAPAEPEDPAEGTQVLWCAPAAELRQRHPEAVAAIDRDHPDGCVDLIVDVDARGRLDWSSLECLGLDDGLVGLPITDVLPELVRRVRDLLH